MDKESKGNPNKDISLPAACSWWTQCKDSLAKLSAPDEFEKLNSVLFGLADNIYT